MAYRAALLNFSKGEISPEMEGRFDLSAYQVGLRRAKNVKIRRIGGVSKRMGTRFVARALSDTARLIPFQFSDEQGYALEFGQAYMRPLALGGAVLEEGLKITAITRSDPAQITVANHGYSVGDQLYIKSDNPLAFGMYEILGHWLTITSVLDANRVAVDHDTSNYHAFKADTGTVRADPPPAPPTPPTVPPPATPAPAPVVGSGGSGGYTGGVVGGSGSSTWVDDVPGEKMSSK